MTKASYNLKGKRFGRLVALEPTDQRQRGRIVWRCKCDCGNEHLAVSTDLVKGDTQSCGCLKDKQDEVNLRKLYDAKRVDGVAMHLFNDKPREDSSTGYRGVFKYKTRQGKERYGAWITVKGKRYYKKGFMTPKEAYHKGRLMLEEKYLPEIKKETRSMS